MKLLALAAKRCKRMLVKKAKADQADEDYTVCSLIRLYMIDRLTFA